MTIDERLEALTTNMELLQGMLRDLTIKIDALADTSAKHENIAAKHEHELHTLRGRMLRAASGLMGMGESEA
jgi:hypothetical protein